jgi:hypothetical protein
VQRGRAAGISQAQRVASSMRRAHRLKGASRGRVMPLPGASVHNILNSTAISQAPNRNAGGRGGRQSE